MPKYSQFTSATQSAIHKTLVNAQRRVDDIHAKAYGTIEGQQAISRIWDTADRTIDSLLKKEPLAYSQFLADCKEQAYFDELEARAQAKAAQLEYRR